MVTKIEPPDGDPMERYCSPWYRDLTRGQQVLKLNLREGKDAGIFRDLLAESDLLLTSHRKAGLQRLGLAWQQLHRDFPQLCQVAIVGYSGADSGRAGHDLTYQATVGLLNPPHIPKTLLVDIASAEKAVSCALALLLECANGGTADYAEVVMAELASEFAAPLRYGLTAPNGLLGGGIPEYNLYQTLDGWVALAALERHFAEKVVQELNLTQLDELPAVFRLRTADQWEHWAAILDIPLVSVRTI